MSTRYYIEVSDAERLTSRADLQPSDNLLVETDPDRLWFKLLGVDFDLKILR